MKQILTGTRTYPEGSANLGLFEGFGDNALIFAPYFWIECGPEVNPLQVASDLRFMIDRRFAGKNIVLASPGVTYILIVPSRFA